MRRHMKLNHDPEKRKKREEEKRTKLKSPSVEYFFRPAKQHTKGEKKEAAALMTSLAAEKYVSINQMQRYIKMSHFIGLNFF